MSIVTAERVNKIASLKNFKALVPESFVGLAISARLKKDQTELSITGFDKNDLDNLHSFNCTIQDTGPQRGAEHDFRADLIVLQKILQLTTTRAEEFNREKRKKVIDSFGYTLCFEGTKRPGGNHGKRNITKGGAHYITRDIKTHNGEKDQNCFDVSSFDLGTQSFSNGQFCIYPKSEVINTANLHSNAAALQQQNPDDAQGVCFLSIGDQIQLTLFKDFESRLGGFRQKQDTNIKDMQPREYSASSDYTNILQEWRSVTTTSNFNSEFAINPKEPKWGLRGEISFLAEQLRKIINPLQPGENDQKAKQNLASFADLYKSKVREYNLEYTPDLPQLDESLKSHKMLSPVFKFDPKGVINSAREGDPVYQAILILQAIRLAEALYKISDSNIEFLNATKLIIDGGYGKDLFSCDFYKQAFDAVLSKKQKDTNRSWDQEKIILAPRTLESLSKYTVFQARQRLQKIQEKLSLSQS